MAEGFSLELEDYCSYCRDFKPDVEKVETTTLGDRVGCYHTTIRCENAYKCARISENIRKQEDL